MLLETDDSDARVLLLLAMTRLAMTRKVSPLIIASVASQRFLRLQILSKRGFEGGGAASPYKRLIRFARNDNFGSVDSREIAKFSFAKSQKGS